MSLADDTALSTTTRSTLVLPKLKFGASWIASEPTDLTERFLDGLDRDTLLALPYLFPFWAMPHQVAPEGDWRTWVVLGGRGAGKTRAGAEWVRGQVEGAMPLSAGQASRVALIGETYDQARDVMVEGPSGIRACSPPDRMPEWQATRRRLVWPNGAVAQVFSANDPEALRGPQFDAAWVDEVGCPSVDKGANEPNKFYDPKSSESDLPHYSTGARDDFMQMQYLRAQLGYWQEPANNPVSASYGGPMVDVDRAFVWAWDARPYPAFPARSDLWSDGGNYALGHWLNGRTSSRSLASVVAEICDRAGLGTYDVSGLYGLVRGYVVSDGGTAREALQPLMLAHGFDAVERDGVLVFRSRDARVSAVVDPERLAVNAELDSDLERVRQPFADTVGRVRVNSFEADGDYAVRASEAIFPDEATRSVSQSDVPLVLTETEARAVADRWLTEARIGRDAVRFAMPASCSDLGAGDVVEIAEPGGAARYRVDRVEVGADRLMEAVRVAPEAVAAGEVIGVEGTSGGSVAPYVAPLPVFPVFLDLPLLSGVEAAYAPKVAVYADPWPGTVAVYSSASENGFVLDGVVSSAAVIGETVTALAPAAPGLWDRGVALRVSLYGGSLMSAEPEAVLGGANVAVIGTGQDDVWEVFQFAEAELVSPGVYDLRMRLRGQAGTDAVTNGSWPAGSRFVLMSQALMQVDHGSAARGLARNYRIGPASRGVDDTVYVAETRAFEGVGLRPLAPVHLRAATDGAGGEVVTWVRRTRVDGDSWQGFAVPLGEEAERYLVRVEVGGAVVREDLVTAPSWTYAAADRVSDGVTGAYEVAVAQVSESFGPGPYRRISRNG